MTKNKEVSVSDNKLIEQTRKLTKDLKSMMNNQELNSYIKSDINIIKEFYRNSGFYFVKIDAEIEKLNHISKL